MHQDFLLSSQQRFFSFSRSTLKTVTFHNNTRAPSLNYILTFSKYRSTYIPFVIEFFLEVANNISSFLYHLITFFFIQFSVFRYHNYIYSNPCCQASIEIVVMSSPSLNTNHHCNTSYICKTSLSTISILTL